jgi:membrane-associated phospholipid phosphatase
MLATRDRVPTPQLGRPATCVWMALGLAIVGVAALSVDVPVSRWVLTHKLPHELRRFIDLCEVFGHGFGVALILLTVWVLDPTARRRMPRLLAMSFGAGILANLGKLAIARTRPISFDFAGRILDSFGGWFPLLANDSRGQGFPSSHVATAVGLAIGLSWLYPRGRWLFCSLALFVAAQRLASGAHFLSDTLWGAAVAAGLCGILQVRSEINKRWVLWESGNIAIDQDSHSSDRPLAA